MSIDADHLFRAKHEDIVRLCLYLRINPFGRSRRDLVLQLLLRMVP